MLRISLPGVAVQRVRKIKRKFSQTFNADLVYGYAIAGWCDVGIFSEKVGQLIVIDV